MAKPDPYHASPLGVDTKAQLEHRQGFTFPGRPTDPPVLPYDLSDLDGADLMKMFSLFTAWTDYAAAQVGLAVVAEREAERILERKEAEAWRDLPKTSVTAAKVLVVLDTDVAEAREGLDEAYAYRRLVTDLASRYERDAAVLSRELTRRTSETAVHKARRRWEP